MATPRPKKNPRLAALRALAKQPHRYVNVRRVTLGVTMVLLYLIPIVGLSRADLVRGHHIALFEPTWLLPAIMGMTIVAALFWAATVLVTTFMGRVFCGFGCLVGHSARLADATEALKGRGPLLTQLAVSAIFAGGIANWWVDYTVLWQGTPGQIAAAVGIYLFFLGVVLAHGRWWRWGFCKQACPIGIYYSVISQDSRFGVRFTPETCNDCNLCDKACPVNLHPRHLAEPHQDAEGASFSDFPARNHCLICGDCVRACEISLKKTEGAPALSLDFRPDEPRRRLPLVQGSSPESAADASSDASGRPSEQPPSSAAA
ncbi:MAG: 4Fe-4S binding protein [Myxococcales bacterium]|nr:4Fe-4S binding protein [Myxococcales bacterium]